MKILLIGGGLIGRERLDALKLISTNFSLDIDITVVDSNQQTLSFVKDKYNCTCASKITDLTSNSYDWVFVSTPHSEAIDLIIESYQIAKNILVEKPLGRNLEECNKIIDKKPQNVNLYVGLNYRFYSGINQLLNHVKEGFFGDIISVNMILGHGNAPGMEKSWKLDPIMCGGGCLIDPGVHLLDLALIISDSELKVNGGSYWNGFWKTGIEEEVHICLDNKNKTIFNIQTSLNRWKSTFRIEVNGSDGYGIVSGRGRSYGNQEYITGKRWGWQSGVSQTESEYHHLDNYSADDSFYECMIALFSLESTQITNNIIRPASEVDGKNVMRLLKDCRESLDLNDSC